MAALNKDALYGKYQATEDWKARLHRRAAHKALDIGDDDMNISPKTTINGLGWKEMLVMALVGLAFYFGSQSPVATQQQSPIDSEYEVRFYDKDGNPIEIPQYQPKKVR